INAGSGSLNSAIAWLKPRICDQCRLGAFSYIPLVGTWQMANTASRMAVHIIYKQRIGIDLTSKIVDNIIDNLVSDDFLSVDDPRPFQKCRIPENRFSSRSG